MKWLTSEKFFKSAACAVFALLVSLVTINTVVDEGMKKIPGMRTLQGVSSVYTAPSA